MIGCPSPLPPPDPAVLDEAAAQVARLRSGRATAADRHAAARWREANPVHAAAFDDLEDLWALAADLEEDPLTGKARPAERLLCPPPRARSRLRLAAATVTALMLWGLVGWVLPHLDSGWPVSLRADLATATAETRTEVLADGSRLSLGARSSADVRMDDGGRQITLRAGALFVQVAPDAGRPFQVEAVLGSGQTVRVTALGTAFEVAHADGGGLRIAVAEHAVRIDGLHPDGPNMPSRPMTLGAGQRVRIAADGAMLAGALPPDTVAPWRAGRLIAENERLDSVVERLAPYLSGWLVITDAKAASLRVSLVLDLTDAGSALETLQAALPLTVRRAGPLGGLIASRPAATD